MAGPSSRWPLTSGAASTGGLGAAGQADGGWLLRSMWSTEPTRSTATTWWADGATGSPPVRPGDRSGSGPTGCARSVRLGSIHGRPTATMRPAWRLRSSAISLMQISTSWRRSPRPMPRQRCSARPSPSLARDGERSRARLSGCATTARSLGPWRRNSSGKPTNVSLRIPFKWSTSIPPIHHSFHAPRKSPSC